MVLRSIILTLLVLPTPAMAGVADDAVRLTYRLPASEVLYYDASSTLTQRFSVMDRPIESAVTTDLELRMTVVENVLQRATVDVEYDYGRIHTRLEGFEEVPVQDTVIEVDAIKGLRLRMQVEPTGTVSSQEVLAAHEESAEIMAMLRSTRIFDRLFTVFPSTDVSNGHQWSVPMHDTTIAPQGLGLVVTDGTLEHTFLGTRDTLGVTCWVVDVTSSSLRQFGEFKRGDVQMTLDGGGSIVGRAYHDLRTGAVVASRSQINTTVTMTFTGAQKTSIPVESTVVLELHQPTRTR